MVGRAPTRARSLPGSCLVEVFSQSHGMATHQRRSRPNAKGRGSAATAFISPQSARPRVKSGRIGHPRGATRPHAGLAAARHLTRAGGLPRHSRSLPTAPNHPRTVYCAACLPACLPASSTHSQSDPGADVGHAACGCIIARRSTIKADPRGPCVPSRAKPRESHRLEIVVRADLQFQALELAARAAVDGFDEGIGCRSLAVDRL